MNKQLTNEQKQQVLSHLLKSFTAPEGYEVGVYYGVLMMVYKKNGDYHLKLQYDYGKAHPVNSQEPLIIDNLDEALMAYQILAENITGKATKRISVLDMIASTTDTTSGSNSTGF